MRFDKATVTIGGVAVVATVVLGALAGALAGVLTALAGAVFVVGWQVATGYQARVQEKGDLLNAAARKLARPVPVADSPAGYLRPEAEVVGFRDREELGRLCEWLVSSALTGVQLVTGQAGSGKTRLARQLAAEAEGQYGFRCYWVGPGGQQLAADAARHGGTPVLLIVDYAETN